MTLARWQIPENWTWVEARDVARIVGGGTPPSKDGANFADDGIPWIGPADLTGHQDAYISRGRRDLSERGYARSGATVMPAGTVLFSSRAPIGYCAIAANPISTNQGFKSWVCERDVVPEFVRYYLLSSVEYVDSLASGTTFREVSGKRVEAIAFPLPPAAEQRRIAAKLDALSARLARARTELERVPILARHLRQSAISVVSCTDPARLVRFGDVIDYKGGSQPPKSTFHAEPGEGRIRLLQIRDFASDQKAVYIDDNGKWPRCQADDIMIGRYGASVGKILTGKSGAYNVALVKMVFDREQIDPRFLFQWLKGDTFQGRLREISRSAQDGFNKEDLVDLPFPFLALAEQAEIASKVDALVARADRLEAEATRARTLLDRLESALLAKAFRGELAPQDPNDEPAEALLDRIRAQRAAAPKAKGWRR